MAAGAIGLIIGAIVLVAIVCSSLWNSEDVKRYQALKNKRRFDGKRLSAQELEELDRLAKRYWWY
jgi:FtsZ-interacting cell division protein ZipA